MNRSVVLGRDGMVATSHPAAALAGLDILRAGGSAADAAIVANVMLGVVEPMSCGVGGDLFALYWDANTGRIDGLNAAGRSPRAADLPVFARLGLTEIPATGPLSWSVPGCVSGWQELAGRYGRVGWGRLFEPAIETARRGFAVSQVIAGDWKAAEVELRRWPGSHAFLVAGRAPKFGDVIANPHLADTCERLARHGPEDFYEGSIAERLVAFSREVGGLLAADDLRAHRADWVAPVHATYRGHEVWQLPPSGQGIAVLQMLNVLERFDLAAWGPGSAEVLHVLIESKKLAYADRAAYYCDPDFGRPPVAALISKEYAAEQAARIRMDRAATDVSAGRPQPRHGDTVYVSAVDADRNACSLIQSLYCGFGSGVSPPGLGFALQNRGCLFALDPAHPNCLEPGKRPFHTIIPSLATRGGRPWLCFGVMGGDMQPQGQVQVLMNLIDFGMNVQAAGDAPRARHDGSATPRGLAAAGAGHVLLEPDLYSAAAGALRSRGHRVSSSTGGFGGYQGILIDWERGVLHGGTESRKDGAAVGL